MKAKLGLDVVIREYYTQAEKELAEEKNKK